MNATQASDEESDEPAAKRRILNGRASKSTNGSRHLNSNGNGNGNGPSHSGDEEGNGGEDDDEGDGVEWTKEGFVPRPINKDEATFAAVSRRGPSVFEVPEGKGNSTDEVADEAAWIDALTYE